MTPGVSGVAGEVLDRAAEPEAYARWEAQVRRIGYCRRPLRLAGQVVHVDEGTGEYRVAYDTTGEPDGSLLKACGQRREAVCPSCSWVYRRDAFELVAAGLRGGKGVPGSVAAHPALFATFTAPSFGPVHSRREADGKVQRCRPRREAVPCAHGRSIACRQRHGADDPELGQPLCADCFDYEGAVVWNALAPELWRRTTIYLRRSLARRLGHKPTAFDRLVRVSYVKVAEFQRRGLVHFHAVIRVDAAGAQAPDEVEPPPLPITVADLEHAVREAAAGVSVPWPALDRDERTGQLVMEWHDSHDRPDAVRWGAQLDVKPLGDGPNHLCRGRVAGYLAKYSVKSADSFGGVNAPIKTADELDVMPVSEHVGRLVQAAWHLGARRSLDRLRLRAWAHMLGFGGHWGTKSRRYSTTFEALRAARETWRERQRRKEGRHANASGGTETGTGTDAGDQDFLVVSSWQLIGIGYATLGDALLAETGARRAAEARQFLKEAKASAA